MGETLCPVTDDAYPPTRPNWLPGVDDFAKHLGQGVYASPGLRGNFPTELGGVQLEMRLADGRYEVKKLTLRRLEDTPPITSELLRRIRVQELINTHVPEAVNVYEPGSDTPRPVVLTDEERHRLVSKGPDDEVLRWVGRLYILGQLLGAGPAKYVRDSLGVPTSTAGNWVRRAKDRGFIDG